MQLPSLRTPLVLAVVTLAALGACRKPAPARPTGAETSLPPLEVSKGKSWLFTYLGEDGRFATTDKAESVPRGAHGLVRVTDPAQGATERRDGAYVYALDLDELTAKGKVMAQVLSREAFETGAMAQLPPGESSPLRAPHPAAAPAGAAAPGSPAPVGGPPVVTVYGTSWCEACQAARRYLSAHKIPFADKDIEQDPAAARELTEKAQRLGVPADRVPILDVRGRLMIGFDQARLEALLGEPT